MPELPEVETIRRDLEVTFKGRTFAAVSLAWPGAVAYPAPEDFAERLVGQTVAGLDRRGKYLLIRLLSGEVLIVHLRMSGQLVHRPADVEPEPYTRAVFTLDDGSELRFADLRKFGRFWLVPGDDLVVGKLGPEPLDDSFTFDVFCSRLRRKSGLIKPVLLDQAVLAGVGNIYADEALFAAGIHPQRRVKDLSDDELRALYEAVRSVLDKGVRARGTTVDRYRDGAGRRGRFQEQLRVFRRTGESCPICGATIERLVVGGRGTHVCPCCQKRQS